MNLDDSYEQWQKKYGEECKKRLEDDPKFNWKHPVFQVTPEQAILICEPDDAPENFYCDGEISHFEAMENWLSKLQRAGMSPLQRVMAKEYVFGK